MKHEESRIQTACVQWFDLQHPELSVIIPKTTYRNGRKYVTNRRVSLLFAIPNGGFRQIVESKIMVGEGVRPGVSDLFLSVPRGGYHGLYIEMKTGTGKISAEQKTFQEMARKQGYAAVIIRSVKDFVTIVSAYLSGKMVADQN